MGNKTIFSLLKVIACVLLFMSQSGALFAGNTATDAALTPEKLISEHVKSIGSSSLLGSVKSRALVGITDVEFIQGMSGSINNGLAMLVSSGDKMTIKLEYKTLEYDNEYFSYDGKEVSVGNISPGQRSPLGDFLNRFTGIMKQGFLGGILSLNWPLLDKPEDLDKLKLQTAIIDDRNLYELEWPMQVLGNIKIRMYFEPETFRHVQTTYSIRLREEVSIHSNLIGNMGEVDEESGDVSHSNLIGDLIPDSIYTLTEKFDDFKKVKGMMLPHKYTLDYSFEGQGPAFIGKWVLKASKWTFNQKFDDKIFKALK